MYEVRPTKSYRKSIKRLVRSGSFKIQAVELVINTIAAGKPLGPKYGNHKLQGEYLDCFECHIKDNLLLIYKLDAESKTMTIINIGTHAKLFD